MAVILSMLPMSVAIAKVGWEPKADEIRSKRANTQEPNLGNPEDVVDEEKNILTFLTPGPKKQPGQTSSEGSNKLLNLLNQNIQSFHSYLYYPHLFVQIHQKSLHHNYCFQAVNHLSHSL